MRGMTTCMTFCVLLVVQRTHFNNCVVVLATSARVYYKATTPPRTAHRRLIQAIEQVPTSQQTQVQQNKQQLIQTIEQVPASQ